MATASTQERPIVVATADSKIGFQANKTGGGILRTRLPTEVIEAMAGEKDEYFRWVVLAYPNGAKRVIGDLISAEEASPRDLMAEKQQAAKGSKLPVGKKGSTKSPTANDSFADAFGGGSDEEEDGYADAADDDEEEEAPPAKTLPKKGGIVARGGTASGNGKGLPTVAKSGTPTREGQRAALPTRATTMMTGGGRQPRVQGPISKPGIARKKGGVKYTDLPE
jgi:hypothetical protein